MPTPDTPLTFARWARAYLTALGYAQAPLACILLARLDAEADTYRRSLVLGEVMIPWLTL